MNSGLLKTNLEVAKPLDVNLEKLLSLAEATLRKAKVLLNHAVGEDSVDLVNLMNNVKNYAEKQDEDGLEMALNELTDLVYYLELSS